ncbi:hypothetical protein [Myroides pelagicus]|uniref:N-acetyltransferase domain-containing protein n=1 Tax=Myroides pelagicus TaxID=270914 RepID=A0A7K1GLI3_9FLAO|nr:hypothetical protein [Myroides pelagicus]MTH29717.1 hypothetical protein [Myroides pelagicus]
MIEISLNITYSFTSSVIQDEIDTTSYFQNYIAKVYTENKDGHDIYVGKISFRLLDLAKVDEVGDDLHDVFDTYDTTFRWGQEFYDIIEGGFHHCLISKYPDLAYEIGKICFIEEIVLLKAFRGKGIGTRILEDIRWNFSNQCILFVLKAYPLQFDISKKNTNDEKEFDLKELEKDQEKAVYKLKTFYTRSGFTEFKEIEDMFFYCSIYQ